MAARGARATAGAMPVIGYLGAESPAAFASRVRAFRQGLGETGYVEGRNVAIEFRWAEGQHNRLPALAADLVGRPVTVIVAPGGAPAALAAKSATTTIPIVFEMGADPIAMGLVETLKRPGANLTGVTSLNVQVTPKRLEILHEVVPAAAVIAVLLNPTSPTAGSQLKSLQVAADALGVRLHVLHASAARDFDAVFETLTQLRLGGLVVASDTFFATHAEQLASHNCPPCDTRHPSVSRLCRGGRPDELRRQFHGIASAGWHPDRTRSQGGQSLPTCRSSRSPKSS